jgi:hypothetical protein
MFGAMNTIMNMSNGPGDFDKEGRNKIGYVYAWMLRSQIMDEVTRKRSEMNK